MRIIGNDQKNNGQNFWEILERIIGKISSIIGAGLGWTYSNASNSVKPNKNTKHNQFNQYAQSFRALQVCN